MGPPPCARLPKPRRRRARELGVESFRRAKQVYDQQDEYDEEIPTPRLGDRVRRERENGMLWTANLGLRVEMETLHVQRELAEFKEKTAVEKKETAQRKASKLREQISEMEEREAKQRKQKETEQRELEQSVMQSVEPSIDG